ncbi:hypothetical protein TrVGV298_003337 [Trichoderma virens]|nr:hypothetical protein TrVGV298_003337 [Trichoderma virens]
MPSNETVQPLTGATQPPNKSLNLPKAKIIVASSSLADNSVLLEYMAGFINRSYHSNYDGLVDTKKHIRTSASELSQKIRDHQIAIAWKPSSDPDKEIAEDIIGCVSIELIGPSMGNLGLLTCHLEHRGTRVGQQLMEFAESWARSLGAEEMQLEILVPDGWEHEENSRVVRWANEDEDISQKA